MGRSPQNFATFTNASPKILELAPQNFGGEKHAKFGPISDPFPLQAQISPEWTKISKIENYLTDSVPSRIGRKKVGELWTTNHRDLEVQLYP